MTEIKLEQWCYLIDLERSIKSGIIHYWKPHKLGYTTNLKEAGQYPQGIAKKIQERDLNRTTVLILESVVNELVNE